MAWAFSNVLSRLRQPAARSASWKKQTENFLNGWIRSTHNDDFIMWRHFPWYWPFVQGIHRSLLNSPHKGQWCRALMFSLFCASINGGVNNRKAGDLKCHHAHYDIVMFWSSDTIWWCRSGTTLGQEMACHLFGAKPLCEPVLISCQLDP